MGLFGKKKAIVAKLMHYEGLPNIPPNYGVEMRIEGNNLVITQLKMNSNITLPIEKIVFCQSLQENDYLTRYKNTSIEVPKELYRQKMYWIINYKTEDTETKNLVFWNALSENGKMQKLAEKLNEHLQPQNICL